MDSVPLYFGYLMFELYGVLLNKDQFMHQMTLYPQEVVASTDPKKVEEHFLTYILDRIGRDKGKDRKSFEF